MVIADLYIRVAVESELELTRNDGIIDDPDRKALVDYLAVVGIELSGSVVALGRHDYLLYLVVHPALRERLGHERENLTALVVRHDIGQDDIERVVELTRRGVLRALDESHDNGTLSRGSADIALVVDMADTAIDQSLTAAELDGIAGGYLLYLRCGAIDIIRLIGLNRKGHAAERVNKLREALEIDADIMINLNLVVILKRLDKCRGTAPEIGMVSLAAALGAVDVHIGVAVSEERHERYRLGLFVEREQDDGIRASAFCLAGLAVNAEEQNIDYILARILRAAVLRPRGYKAVDARSVADIIHSLKLLLGRKGAIRIAVSAVIDGNKSELIADIDAAADYSKGKHHTDNGNRDFEIALVVVHKKLFKCSFFFLFHKTLLIKVNLL